MNLNQHSHHVWGGHIVHPLEKIRIIGINYQFLKAMKPCFSIESITEGTGGHFYRYGYGYGCSVRVLGTGTGVGYGCWVRVLGTGTGVGYCWVRLRELVLGILLLGAGTGVGYMFGCRHRTHVPYPCTVPMYRATVPMYSTNLPSHRTHRTHVPYPPYPPYVPS